MNEMYFKSILIADIKEKTARFQKFQKGFNVITSQENHVGKSSMLKSLYYAMGAEIDYDNIWDKNTKVYIVNICINEKNYTIEGADIFLDYLSDQSKSMSVLYRTQIS